MRILLASSHRYPASGKQGAGLHPKQYPSGSGYHIHDLLAKGLAEDGHEVFYFVGQGWEAPPPADVVAVPHSDVDVDIAHAPIGPPGFAESIADAAAARGTPCLMTCHMKEYANGAPNWLFVSRALAAAYGSRRFVLNGIDPADFMFSEEKQDYLLFMAAMNRAKEKGLDIALSLAKKGYRVVVAGTALDYASIERVSELCDLAGAEYVGDVRGSRKAELLAGARALLFPSRLSEGCPVVVLEAMMSGTPVISTRGGGTVEIVTPETGLLCDETDDWAEAVERTANISPVRCREIALEKYHYRRMVRDYLREYEQEIT